jgi:hypothetical protein
MTALIEIGEVARTRPTVDTGPVAVAAWYRRKAAMLHRLGPGYAAAARRAEAHARDLVAGRVIA